MQVRVLLFGPYALALGQSSCTVSVRDDATACAVLDEIKRSMPALAPLMTGARLAVNHSFASLDVPIRENDEVALIGMVSGG